jgi:hypothetical protein
MMSGPYVNDDGDIWVERGAVPWPKARVEARSVIDWMYWATSDRLVYEGIDRHILVSDGNEAPCESAYEADRRGEAPRCDCCRVIDAYHFRTEER